MINWRLSLLSFLLSHQVRGHIILSLLLAGTIWTAAQNNDYDQARCFERPLHMEKPRSYPYLWCLELIFHDATSPTLSFSALTVADDGTLYATRPLYGDVFTFDDTNGDDLPDSPRLIAGGLTLPNGIDWHNGHLYVSGGKHIYRINPDDGQVDILLDDLPFAGGLWTGDLLIAPDNRLYVGTSYPCDDCLVENPEQGAILSLDLDGTDRQIVAQGFRQPAGLTWHDGAIWVTDTAPRSFLSADETETDWLDEINRLEQGAHYGYPFCVGDNQPHIESPDFTCSNTLAPFIQLPTQSNPLAIVSYPENLPLPFNDQLVIALGGSSQTVDVRGHQIVALIFDEANQPSQIEIVVPFRMTTYSVRRIMRYSPDSAPFDYFSQIQANDNGDGIWPYRVLDMALSPDGSLYVTISDGHIFIIRS